jgi:hypothetical protein
MLFGHWGGYTTSVSPTLHAIDISSVCFVYFQRKSITWNRLNHILLRFVRQLFRNFLRVNSVGVGSIEVAGRRRALTDQVHLSTTWQLKDERWKFFDQLLWEVIEIILHLQHGSDLDPQMTSEETRCCTAIHTMHLNIILLADWFVAWLPCPIASLFGNLP